MPTEGQTRALWGDLFEVAVKRGCLALLQERGLLPEDSRHLRPWRELRVDDLQRHLLAQADALDPTERARLASSLEHLLLAGWGLGWTVLRAYLERFAGAPLAVRGLFCPLALPDRRAEPVPDAEARVAAVWEALGLDGRPDPAWAGRGEPANADFLLLGDDGTRSQLLCLEFSLHAQPEAVAQDFAEQAAHLGELERYVQRLEARGVFTRLAAELAGETFVFSDALVSHLAALTTHDKPLYKLCQGSSYAARLVHLLARRVDRAAGPTMAQVIAVTSAGLEALSAPFAPEATDPRAQLMAALGQAYRRVAGVAEDDRAALDAEIRAVQAQIARSLPPRLRGPFAEAFAAPPSSRAIDVRLAEPVEGFVNPADRHPTDALLEWVEDTPEAATFLGAPPPEAVAAELERLVGRAGSGTLRDLHAAALIAGLGAARPGRVTIVAAEGHPGVGKTTAVVQFLQRLPPEQGYLLLYASPRVVINTDVTQKVARDADGRPSGVLALTTNARLIRSARRWWTARPAPDRPEGRRFVDAAVVADGVAGLRHSAGSTLFLDPDQAQQIDEEYASSDYQKETWDEGLDVLRARPAPGVLFTLARAARGCLAENPDLNRLVLTAAIQGYRDDGRGLASTVDRLSELFRHPAETPRGLRERRAFAARIPRVVVMVDEIAGDGAGTPFVHALARWLDRELIEPFVEAGEACPFIVSLVLSDASLTNEAVLRSYLAHAAGAPEKVIVAGSDGPRPFRLAAGTLEVGGRARPALHVMADGFPARRLDVEYHVRLQPVLRPARPDGSAMSPRTAILEQHGRARLRAAVEEVFGTLARLPPGQQVILFAQDKRFLRDVATTLVRPELLAIDDGGAVDTHGVQLRPEEIGLLDSSVAERERRRLIQPQERDAKRVFLMTSSGARGVSFPLATAIIAFVPAFAVESGFMELAQLIYRGRGSTRDARSGATIDGDRFDRRLVLLLQDFVLADEPIDDRQWLRRTIDLVSALVLLRATLLTRITGDAGIPGQRAAVVPVGRIGTEEAGLSLSHAVATFLREGSVYLAETIPPRVRVAVDHAVQDVQEAFAGLRWTGRAGDRGRVSVVSPAVLRGLRSRVCAAAAPLLWNAGTLVLPEQVYGLGPLWLERWADIPAEEGFRFAGVSGAHRERLRRLLGSCRAIGNNREVPAPLRRAARDLVAILQRPDGLLDVSFMARKGVQSDRVWVCLPVDYERLCAVSPADEEEGRRFRLEEPEHWLEALIRAGAAATSLTAVNPVLPRFEDRPFLALLTPGDPTGLERAFDDRYFMASSELNLLNTLLFVGESPQ